MGLLTDMFSGAEVQLLTYLQLAPKHLIFFSQIVALVQEAALCAMHQDIQAQCVAKRHFDEALKIVRPRTDSKSVEFYENYNTGRK